MGLDLALLASGEGVVLGLEGAAAHSHALVGGQRAFQAGGERGKSTKARVRQGVADLDCEEGLG